MNEFNRVKGTGVRWLKKPVGDLHINVKLKPQDGILSLPKFEDYANETNELSIQQLENKSEEYTFKWQEKVFSSWELQRYSDIHNCLSELELEYNEMLNNLDFEPSKVFTFIHQDYYRPLPLENKKIKTTSDLTSCFERLTLNDKMGKFLCSMYLLGDTSSMGHLFRSTDNIVSEEEHWTAMHVVFDNSEYNEDSQLLLKQEATIVSLYHNKTQNYLIISPDVNNLELNPYTLETPTGLSLGYHYSVEVEFEEDGGGEELATLLKKLHKKWERQQKQLVNFLMPELGKKQYFVSLEILTATDFDVDNLYVEFNVKIPDGLECSDILHGRTHVSKSVKREDDVEEWHFGHIIDLNIIMDIGGDRPPLELFFEVISKDWWGRHRTEGYGYLSLTLQPGRFFRQLSCSRPDERDSVAAESRRFFVGGCHLIKNLEVLAKPQLIDANYKFTSTGSLHVRWSTLLQASLPGAAPAAPGPRSAAALLTTAEAVLRQYRRARARLQAATQGIAVETRKPTDKRDS